MDKMYLKFRSHSTNLKSMSVGLATVLKENFYSLSSHGARMGSKLLMVEFFIFLSFRMRSWGLPWRKPMRTQLGLIAVAIMQRLCCLSLLPSIRST